MALDDAAFQLVRATRTEGIFGRYVSPEIAQQILDAEGTLQPQIARVAVMFCDIRGFTRFSEGKTPCAVADFLSRYWELVVLVTAAGGGTVNKFIGDGVLILFGVPTEVPDCVQSAAHVALSLGRNLETMLKPHGLGYGIGLHYGDVVAGEIGTGERSEYTVIGEAVNLASRLETLNRDLGTNILISESVRAELDDRFSCRAMGPQKLRGIASAVPVFELKAEFDARIF